MASEYLNNKIFESLILNFQQLKRQKTVYQTFMDDITATEERTLKRGRYHKPSSWDATKQSYLAVSSDFDLAQQELAKAFYILSENIVRYAKFNLIDQDDAIQEGVMVCFEKIDRFDPVKGKAFNYMTTCILNTFRQLYRTARNYNELKRKYLHWISFQLEKQAVSKKGIYKGQAFSQD